MKATTALLCALFPVAAFAGQPVVTDSKTYKQPVEVESCFGDQELQIDVFGQYTDGNSPNHAGTVRDHGWGGGLGINYFFTRNLGVGVDAAWIYATEAPALGGGYSTIHNFSASLIARFPINDSCVAPYIYAGGGAAVDGEQWASAHGGVGIEWRVQPQKFGIFLDARWTYYGDRFGHGDLNNLSGRLGLRWVL